MKGERRRVAEEGRRREGSVIQEEEDSYGKTERRAGAIAKAGPFRWKMGRLRWN